MTSSELKRYIEKQREKRRKYMKEYTKKNYEKIRKYNTEFQRAKRAKKKNK